MDRADYLYLTFALHLMELMAAAGVVYVMARLWTTNPGSVPTQLIQHRHRTWFALGLFLTPLALGHLHYWWIMHRSLPGGYYSAQWNISLTVAMDILYGMFMGLTGCLLAPLENDRQTFRHWQAFWIATGLVVLNSLSQFFAWSLGPQRAFYVSDVLMLVIFATFLIAKVIPRKHPQTLPDGTVKPARSPALALVLAFLPSVMLLTLIALLNRSQPPAGLFILCCVISIICCFSASFLLFRRGTGLAIFAGIVFILLNAFVSFLFGCGAILSQMKF